MSTDPIKYEADISPDLAWRKAVARLRTLLRVNPAQCHLFTRRWSVPDGRGGARDLYVERWLSDRYVMVNVTDDLALLPSHLSGTELPDGAYKLTAGKGLVPAEFLAPDTAALINHIEDYGGSWHPLRRTQWGVADSKFRIMLAYAEIWRGLEAEAWERGWSKAPCAMNEGIWNAFTEAFWDKLITFEVTETDLPFRVKAGDEVVGYIARGVLPEGEIDAAMRLLGEPDDDCGVSSDSA